MSRRAPGRRWLLSLCLVGVGALAPGASIANGRYPMANQLVVRPGDPSRLVARTTFGLLRSDDAGATWSWVCEEALGMLDPAEDPAIAVTGDGSTLIAYSQGLAVSHDGCSWSPASGIPTGRFAVDLTVSPARPHVALAIELAIAGAGYDLHLVTSADDGATWAEPGDPIPGFLGATVEVAPGSADRVYVSGKDLATGAPVLARSLDGGRTFTKQVIAGIPRDAGVFIGGVDPADEDVVYLRTSPTATAPGQVIVTRDGGGTYAALLTVAGDVSGFALSADGATIAVGGIDSGLFVGGSGGETFPRTGELKPSCLTWVGARLFACAREVDEPFSIAVSDDDGAHFAPVLRLAEVMPADCPATSSAGRCLARWPPIAATIGADAGSLPADGGVAPRSSTSGCSCLVAEPSRAGSRRAPATSSRLAPGALIALLALACAARRGRSTRRPSTRAGAVKAPCRGSPCR